MKLNILTTGLLATLGVLSLNSCYNDFDVLPNDADYYDQPEALLVLGTDADEKLSGSNVHGGYGDDEITGTAGNDFLDGGRGEDQLFGGEGNDILVSRSDGGEARVGRDYNPYRDPDNLIHPATKTLNPEHPVKGNDVLTGGRGADVFRFIALMNAKEKYLNKHTADDGMLKWMKVAGENTHIHDHWVERIGNDVITDFSRDEGDEIHVVGHTAKVYHAEYKDVDGDGKQETIIYLECDQNGPGAHHKDHIGTITVFGDLVTEKDIYKNKITAIGIIKNIDNIAEALTPRIYETDIEPDRKPTGSNVLKLSEIRESETF